MELGTARGRKKNTLLVNEENFGTWGEKAEAGDAEAQYQIAWYMEEFFPESRQEIENYLQRAAKQRHSLACLRLAELRIESRPEEAVAYLRQADPSAEVLGALARCYLTGQGVAADPEEAERYLVESARKGDGEDMLALARRYESGDGVRRSIAETRKWLYRAQQAGMAGVEDEFCARELESRKKEPDGEA